MAADVKKRLEIEATYADLAGPGIEKTAKQVESVGNKAAKGGEKAAKGWDKFNKSMLTSGDASAKIAGVAGTSFAALGASMSLATANADNLGMASAGAAGSIAAGFGSGGPVGGAIALLSAGVGAAIFAFKQMKEEARESAKVAAEAYTAAAAGIREAAGAARDLRKEQEFRLRIAQRIAGGEEVDVQRLELKREKTKTLNEAIRQHNKMVETSRDLAREVAELDSDDDDERATQARDDLARSTDDLNASEERMLELRRGFAATERTQQIERETAAFEKSQAILTKQFDLARKAAKARIDARQAIDAEVTQREKALRMSSEELRLDTELHRAAELRTRGELDSADAIERVARAEFERARSLKASAVAEKEATKAKQIASSMSGLDFRARRASGGDDPLVQMQLRAEEELARFAGTRAEKAALIRAQMAEQLQLADKIAKAANDERRARQKAAEAFTKAQRDMVAKLRAEKSGTLELFELRKRLAEAAKEGGRAAVEAVKEQLKVEREISAEKKKQTDAAKSASDFASNLAAAMGGPQDKGLMSRRKERQARNRMRKGMREGRLDRDGNRIERGIRGQRRGGFGVIAGGTSEGLGDFSSFGGGAGDMDSEGTVADKAKADAKAAAEINAGTEKSGNVDEEAAKALSELGTATGDANTTAQRILDAAKAATDATATGIDIAKKTADAIEESNAKQAEAATQRERVHAATNETKSGVDATVVALNKQAEAMTQVATAVGKVTTAVDSNTRNVKRLLDAARLAPG